MKETLNWLDKYKPKKLEDVVGNNDVVNTLRRWRDGIRKGNVSIIPHIALIGSAGIGKSCMIECFLNETFGDQMPVIELNASDTRGIDYVRNDIKEFARHKSAGSFMGANGKQLPIPFRIIVLEEADSITAAAQGALRRTIENYSHNCVFFMTVNHPDKIIGPILSRFRWGNRRLKALNSSDVRKIYLRIMKDYPDLVIEGDAMAMLCDRTTHNGDARNAINIFADVSEDGTKLTPITIEDVERVSVKRQFIFEKITEQYILSNIDKLYYEDGYTCNEILLAILEATDDKKIMVNIGDTMIALSSIDETFKPYVLKTQIIKWFK